MFLYFFIIVLLLIEAVIISNLKLNNKKIVYSILAFFQLFFFAGFRGANVGNDTLKYLSLFDFINNRYSDFGHLSDRYGFGYIIFNKLIYCFTTNSQWLIIITSFITIALFIRFFYKNSKNIYISIFLFITLMFYYFTMSGIRQAFAMALVTVAYDFLKKKKIIPYMLIIFIASQFHSMAIIFIFIYPITYLKFNKKNVTLLLIIGIVGFFTFESALNIVFEYFPMYKYYLGSDYFGSGNIANIINAIIPMIILLWGNIQKSTYKYTHNDEENDLIRFLILIGMIFSFISIRASVIDRVYYYFAIFNLIYIPNIISHIECRKNKVMIGLVVIYLCIAYNGIIFIERPDWNRVFPYEFFWSK